jgi:hypothetical protein
MAGGSVPKFTPGHPSGGVYAVRFGDDAGGAPLHGARFNPPGGIDYRMIVLNPDGVAQRL